MIVISLILSLILTYSVKTDVTAVIETQTRATSINVIFRPCGRKVG